MSIENQKEVIKKEIEALNNKLQLLEKTGRELPNENETYHFIETASEFYIRTDSFEGFSQEMDNYKEYNYFTNKNQATRRLTQIRNFFKVMYYLELVNGDWESSLSCSNYVIAVDCNEIICKGLSYTYNVLKFRSKETMEEFCKYITDEEIRTFLNPVRVK